MVGWPLTQFVSCSFSRLSLLAGCLYDLYSGNNEQDALTVDSRVQIEIHKSNLRVIENVSHDMAPIKRLVLISNSEQKSRASHYVMN